MSSSAPGGPVALCVARFYANLAERLETGARAALEEAGVSEVDAYDVPGAFELPLIAKFAAASGRYRAVVCLGAVIRGETDHYDYVCSEAARGIQQVQLETGVPCGFGVLTVDTVEQALDRVTGGSKRDTGRSAVEAALASVAVKDTLEREAERVREAERAREVLSRFPADEPGAR
jgi:6,7-dimethyl-8-ribityllumazine synthase